MSVATLYCGDALDVLRRLPDGAARCCVTSPPYWGLRDYGVEGQLGLEPTPEEYVAKLVAVFREVRRVLTDDGTLWLNLGDCYATGAGRVGDHPGGGAQGARWRGEASRHRDDRRRAPHSPKQTTAAVGPATQPNRMPIAGLKPKDLVCIPWRVGMALQADGWWLRFPIIWHKPNGMPSSQRDRPTLNYEYVLLLSRAERYHYDADAIAEPLAESSVRRSGNLRRDVAADGDGRGIPNNHMGRAIPWEDGTGVRTARGVWTVPVRPYAGAHFATFPEELASRCILAGSAPGDTVLDPFGGSGTVAQVATGSGRDSIYVDLNPAYLDLARQRVGPLLCEDGAPPRRRAAGGAP